MSSWTDRILADALGRAERLIAEENQLGYPLWDSEGVRCYGRQGEESAVVTLARGGQAVIVYEVVGVDWEELR
ncbi:hypothetical protein [Acrocarpospora sp. B8E8]|uniref:hypothetical protein n=1 Tax=Acrocarpospora sp. B8E8 TaxID=3153572 RepID=UPI00325C708E